MNNSNDLTSAGGYSHSILEPFHPGQPADVFHSLEAAMDTPEKRYSVYVHVFPNGLRYVGVTKREPEVRWRKGDGYLRRNRGRIREAILKYGWNSVTHIVLLANITKIDAEKIEVQLIADWRLTDPACGYNTSSGGRLASPITEETRKKLAVAKRGKKHTPEARANMSAARKGKPIHTPESKAKLRAAQKGHIASREARANMSAAQKGRKHKPISAEQKEQIRITHIGMKHTVHTRAKISASLLGKPMSPERREQMREGWVKRKARLNAKVDSF